jgi:hypothetical protein
MKLQDYLDKVLDTYSKGEYYDEVKRAKAEFFSRAGQVAEGSDKFEAQMNAFLDWYLYDRPLEKSQICPAKMFMFDHLDKVDTNDHVIYHDLTKSIHSLFELLKVRGGDVFVKDLFTGEKYIVEDSEINAGFTKGDIFEGRLIKFRDKLVFGNSFVFHPKECRSFIVKEIKKVRSLESKQHLKLMHRLAMMRNKAEQYSHIDVKHIYTESPLF